MGGKFRVTFLFFVLVIWSGAALAAADRPCTGISSINISEAPGNETARDQKIVQYAADELRTWTAKLFGPPQPAAAAITLKNNGKAGDDSFEIVPTSSGVEIRGASARAVLYGAYALIETWGVQFYLSGDLSPAKPHCSLPAKTIRETPVMKMRGVHPYPDFLSGPSSWDEEQFEKYIRQLPKLRLNFFGIHQYTYEPYVDYELDGVHPRSGRLETSATTEWSYGTVRTCDFEVGSGLFSGCEWGSRTALTSTTPEERYRNGEALMRFALTLAHDLGLDTAFGFEPLSNDPEFTELARTREGATNVMRARIDGVLRAFPDLDYVWLFADETNQANDQVLRDTYSLIQNGEQYLKQKAPEKRLMIGGWNTEPSLKRYDRGNRDVSFDPQTVFTSYGNYDPWRTVKQKRHKLFKSLTHDHAIAAWCEYDGRLLTGIQPNVTAYEAMVPLIRKSNSLGFFFLHWNTRACDSNLHYLRQAAWRKEPEHAREFYQNYFAKRLGLRNKDILNRAVAAASTLEKINEALATSQHFIWLMGDDWTYLGPWKQVADAIVALKSGQRLTSEQRKAMEYQVRRAGELSSRFLAPLNEAEAAFKLLPPASTLDPGTAGYLVNRTTFFAAYFREFLRMSVSLQNILAADSRLGRGLDLTPALFAFSSSVNRVRWRQIVALYTEQLDDRGELGLVVSLNQKTLAGLKELEASLAPAAM